MNGRFDFHTNSIHWKRVDKNTTMKDYDYFEKSILLFHNPLKACFLNKMLYLKKSNIKIDIIYQ